MFVGTSLLGVKLKEVGTHMIVYGFGSVAQSAVGLLLLPILTASLTSENFGVYSLLVMVSAAASAVFYLGITSALSRSYFDYSEPDDRRAVFTTAFMLISFGCLLQILFGVFFGKHISQFLTQTEQYTDAVFWALVSGAFTFVNAYIFSYLRLLRKSMASVVLSLLNLIGSISLAIGLLRLFPNDVAVPFQAISLAQIPIFALFLVFYGKGAFIWKIKIDELPLLVPFGLISAMGGFSLILLDWSDRIIISHYLSLDDVGAYSAACRLGLLINTIFILPFSQIWSPMMIEYKDHPDIKEFFSKIMAYFIFFGSLIIFVTAVFAEDLVPIVVKLDVDEQFYYVLMFAMFGALIYGSNNIVTAGMIYSRQLSWMVYIYYCAGLIKVAINMLIVPLFGLLGASIVSLFIGFGVPTSIYMVSRRFFSFELYWRKIIPLLFFCGVSTIFVMPLVSAFSMSVLEKITLCLIVILVSGTVFFTKEDKLIFKGFLTSYAGK